MGLQTINGYSWVRFHDAKWDPVVPDPEAIYCFDSATDIDDLIRICANRPPDKKLKCAGSHWSLSEGTISDDYFIETNWPDQSLSIPRNSGPALDLGFFINPAMFDYLASRPPGLNTTLTLDPCLYPERTGSFYVHIKSGTRIYEAYSLLDGNTDFSGGSPWPGKLATDLTAQIVKQLGSDSQYSYAQAWAFATLGGAGGQTVFGALTTGTHGGDFKQQPISDSVSALHLIVDGGQQYWIEPNVSADASPPQLTDDATLHKNFDRIVDGTNYPINIVRDDNIFNAVTVNGGRFGVVVSLVLRVVPQYCLFSHRQLDDWSTISGILKDKNQGWTTFENIYFAGSATDKGQKSRDFGSTYEATPYGYVWDNRFLQIAVNVCPSAGGNHDCGVTQRNFYPQTGQFAKNPSGELKGRTERGRGSAPGNSGPYSPDTDPTKAGTSGTFLDQACQDGDFILGILDAIGQWIEKILEEAGIPADCPLLKAIEAGAGTLIEAANNVCDALRKLAQALGIVSGPADGSLAARTQDALDAVDALPIPEWMKLMFVRWLFMEIFDSMQSDQDFQAISYAVMDTYSYLDKSCYGNAISIEVFFDADRPDVYCSYVDAILAFEENQQEQDFRFTAGYVSLRYIKASSALLAPSIYGNTVVIEVSGLRAMNGSVPFVENAASVARDPMYAAPFHWGQHNPLNREEVEAIFNAPGSTRLTLWRQALAKLTNNGALDGFSSAFTRQTGLEL